MLDNTWAVIGGQIPQGAPILPCITNNVDWILRLSEAGPCANIVQKYQNNPLLTPNGNKMIFRFSVYLKGIVPLQAYVSKKVLTLNAPKPFTMAVPSFGDDAVHLCTVPNEETFASLSESETLMSKSVDAIRAVLKAFQI